VYDPDLICDRTASSILFCLLLLDAAHELETCLEEGMMSLPRPLRFETDASHPKDLTYALPL